MHFAQKLRTKQLYFDKVYRIYFLSRIAHKARLDRVVLCIWRNRMLAHLSTGQMVGIILSVILWIVSVWLVQRLVNS